MYKPIRILHVLGRTDRGGAESLVMNIYRNIDREKIQFDFAIHTEDRCDFDDEIESLGGRIYHLPRYKVYNHLNYKKAWNDLLNKNNFKAIHGHMNSTASIYLKIAKKKGITTISHIHNINAEGGFKSKIKEIYKKDINDISDYKFACSIEAGHWMYGKDNKDFVVIENGIEVDKFLFNEEVRIRKRRALGIRENEILIGHIGNYRPVKNHKFALEVFKKVYQQNNDYKLAFIGADVRENINLEKTSSRCKKNILFLGSRSDINELLQAIDIFILPSISEGLPIASIEAQAAGLKCIISDKVSKEVACTKNVIFLPINNTDSYNIWSESIIAEANYKRNKTDKNIKYGGYDILKTSLYLGEFYESL